LKTISEPTTIQRPKNEALHIYFVPGRGDYRLSIPGRETSYHDSFGDAMRTRNLVLNGEPAVERAALTPNRTNIERRATNGK
jgi:hypothetical protein